MTVTRNDAATALHDVDSARRHSLTLFKYGLAGPYLLLWGVLWIVAGAVGALSPDNAGIGWLVVDIVGFAATGYLIAIQLRRSTRSPDAGWVPDMRWSARGWQPSLSGSFT